MVAYRWQTRALFLRSLSLSLSVAAWNAVGNEIRRPSVRRGPRTSSISANIQAFRCEGERWKFYDVWGGGGVSLRKGYAVGGRPSIVSGRAAIRMSLIRRGGGGPRPEQMLTIQTGARRHRRRPRRVYPRVRQRYAVGAINIRPTPVLCLYAKHSQLGAICRDMIASISKRQALETCHRRF